MYEVLRDKDRFLVGGEIEIQHHNLKEERESILKFDFTEIFIIWLSPCRICFREKIYWVISVRVLRTFQNVQKSNF